MKTIALTLIFAAMTSVVYAQKANAVDIMDKMLQKHINMDGTDMTFDANMSDNSASGNIACTLSIKKNMFILQTPDMSVWFDGKTQWTYIPRNNEVNIAIPSANELRMINPVLMVKDYKTGFNLSLTGESTSANAKTAYDISLVPKKNDDITKIEIQIEKSSFLPARLVIIMRNNMRHTINIMKIGKSDIPDSSFVFPTEQFPDAEIIDLR